MHTHKLKILTYRWHAAHQYELWRLEHDFTLVRGAGTQLCEDWAYDQRPLPINACFKNIEEIDISDYDLAILHFDENVLHPHLCLGQESQDWGETFKNMMHFTAKMPRVAICHGAPQYIGQYDPNYCGPHPMIYEDSRLALTEALGDTLVVCNSHQVKDEWGFQNSVVIWHGFSPEEFCFGDHTRDCLAPIKSSIAKRAYALGHFELEKFQSLLKDRLAVDYTVTPDPVGNFPTQQAWAQAKYANYRKEIRQYAFYINTTLRSPMPRSRCEAMMSGVITLSLRNHDVDLFIQNGVNGFYADTVEELADAALYIQAHPTMREKMHIAARKTAIEYFHIDRYLAEWAKLIQQRL